MSEHRLEVADVFRAHQQDFLQRWGHVVSHQQRKVLRDIGLCRTAALGSHLERCGRFVKIRHFGFLANRNRREALALCRLHLKASVSVPTTLLTEQQQSALDRRCPRCQQGILHIVARLTAALTWTTPVVAYPINSS